METLKMPGSVKDEEGFKELAEVRTEIGRIKRSSMKDGINAHKIPSHLVTMSHNGSFEVAHSFILEENIPAVFELLKNDNRVSVFYVTEVGRNVIEFDKSKH
jgi:hypothetical protein